jgi:hypothetical protein
MCDAVAVPHGAVGRFYLYSIASMIARTMLWHSIRIGGSGIGGAKERARPWRQSASIWLFRSGKIFVPRDHQLPVGVLGTRRRSPPANEP